MSTRMECCSCHNSPLQGITEPVQVGPPKYPDQMINADPLLMQHPDGSCAKSKVLLCVSIGFTCIQPYINGFYVSTRNSVKRSQVGPNSVSFEGISTTKIKQSEAVHFKIDAATSTNPAKLKRAVKKDGGKQKQPLIALIEDTVLHFRRFPRGLDKAYTATQK